ncbi:MAG: substrate-binding domain-containing protein [Gracilibacteraceae bacterium]|jgi:phosphate transport system substrate-binding protein|nr:substrate-binding domain-containing protein [Gracilibacteraceae bacterium]
MKKVAYCVSLILLLALLAAGCGTSAPPTAPPAAGSGTPAAPPASGTPATPAAPADAAIVVVSREDGSGTRGAFIELFGIEQREADGSRKDLTTKEAIIANQTEVMLVSVAGEANSIGYVSLGSLNNTVKAVSIDGAAATVANVKSGAYSISRPFLIATKGAPSGPAADFTGYILSPAGQEIVESSHYIPVEADASYQSSQPTGKITIAGSSSVTPVMEKLVEAYNAVNPNADIEIQMSDSSAGLTAAIEGTCDIAMASRELKETEAAELTPLKIAIDGIAVIVNQGNPVAELSKDQVKAIFTGDALRWSEI